MESSVLPLFVALVAIALLAVLVSRVVDYVRSRGVSTRDEIARENYRRLTDPSLFTKRLL